MVGLTCERQLKPRLAHNRFHDTQAQILRLKHRALFDMDLECRKGLRRKRATPRDILRPESEFIQSLRYRDSLAVPPFKRGRHHLPRHRHGPEEGKSESNALLFAECDDFDCK